MSTANDTQVGGQHYKVKTIQPWDYIAANGLGYFEGNIVKYVTRWRDKGGVDDLRKARSPCSTPVPMPICRARAPAWMPATLARWPSASARWWPKSSARSMHSPCARSLMARLQPG